MKTLFLKVMLSLLLVLVFPTVLSAKEKSDRIKPAWIKNTPKSLNDRYSFKVVSVDNGKDLASSRLLARAELTRYIEKTFNIQLSEKLKNTSTTTQRNGVQDYDDKETYVLDVKSDEEQVSVYCERVDEYYETNKENGVTVFNPTLLISR